MKTKVRSVKVYTIEFTEEEFNNVEETVSDGDTLRAFSLVSDIVGSMKNENV